MNAIKPETGWALVPREPTEAMKEAAYRKRPFYTGENHAVIYKAMISAAPLAPSIPDAGVVKEWASPRKGANLIAVVAEMDELGDRMAAALTEAANDPSWGITFWRDKATAQARRIMDLELMRSAWREALVSRDEQACEAEARATEQAKRIAGLERDTLRLAGSGARVGSDALVANAQLATLKADVERLTAIIDREAIAHLERLLVVTGERDTARAALDSLLNDKATTYGVRVSQARLALAALPLPALQKTTEK